MSGWSPEAQALMRWKAEREAGERCTGRDDCTAPLHVHGCLADRGACTAPAEHATEPTVQVPVSLIERALKLRGMNYQPAQEVLAEYRALLSQPTPTAEHVKDWTDAQDNEGPGCSCGFNGSFEECAAWRAENPDPPIIADMVPGTTFRAALIRNRHAPGMVYTFQVTYAQPATVKYDGWESYEYVDRIDPSTIRDVTPPYR